jgi:GNAT superfamily N-acetyltransferase
MGGVPPSRRRRAGDGFGPQAAFTPLVAELDGTVVGYVFFAKGYNTDVAGRSMWLHDLFVAPSARGRGVGRALMAVVAAETVRAGCVSLEWGVHPANAGALSPTARADARRVDTSPTYRRAAVSIRRPPRMSEATRATVIRRKQTA